jgi:sporulation protein YlmC with PRC-barrel domain
MFSKLAYAGLLAAVVIGPSALGQGANDAFVTQQGLNQWRISKLVGVTIVGPDEKSVGAVDDILLDHNGNAQAVVIGVGGFLGIGTKDVAVPFKKLQWKTEGKPVMLSDPSPAQPGGGAAQDPMKPAKIVKTDPAATEANQGYPDMGMLDMTKAQLLAAPDFHYAPAPKTAEAGSSGEPQQPPMKN